MAVGRFCFLYVFFKVVYVFDDYSGRRRPVGIRPHVLLGGASDLMVLSICSGAKKKIC